MIAKLWQPESSSDSDSAIPLLVNASKAASILPKTPKPPNPKYTPYTPTTGFIFHPDFRLSALEKDKLARGHPWGPFERDCLSGYSSYEYFDSEELHSEGSGVPYEGDYDSQIDMNEYCIRACCAADSEDEVCWDGERECLVRGLLAIRDRKNPYNRGYEGHGDVRIRKKGVEEEEKGALPGWEKAVQRYERGVDGVGVEKGVRMVDVGSDSRMWLRREQMRSNRRERRKAWLFKKGIPQRIEFKLPEIVTPDMNSPFLVPKDYDAPIRRRMRDESVDDYYDAQVASVLRFLADYYLGIFEYWDHPAESRVELLMEPENQFRICKKLKINSGDVYIEVFGLDKPSRDEPHPSTYCPLFVIASFISRYPKYRVRRVLKKMFLRCFYNYPLHCIENSMIVRLRPAEQRAYHPGDDKIDDQEDLETSVFDFIETLERGRR